MTFSSEVKDTLPETGLMDAAWILPDGSTVGHDEAYDQHGYDAEQVLEGEVHSFGDDDDSEQERIDHQIDLIQQMEESGAIRVSGFGSGSYIQFEVEMQPTSAQLQTLKDYGGYGARLDVHSANCPNCSDAVKRALRIAKR